MTPSLSFISLFLLVLIATMTTAQITRQRTPKVLVYTATRGYRHDSIPTAIEVLRSKASDAGVEFSFTEDQTQFSDSNLATFDCLMFVHNSDQVLDTAGEAALTNYLRSGGNYIGVHSASACLQQNNNYQQTVGAIFDYHPQLQPATFLRLNNTHPATANVPDRWSYTEEVYYFRSDPRSNGAQMLLSVDESSYNNTGTSTGSYPSQGTPHPIAWYIDTPRSSSPLNSGALKAGRSFYTSLGHLNETWQDATFQSHILGGLRWALDGASTRAYGSGLVGNNGSGSSVPASASSPSTSLAPSSRTPTSSTSASGSGTAAASQSSRSAGEDGSGISGIGKKGVLGAAAAAVGLSVLLG